MFDLEQIEKLISMVSAADITELTVKENDCEITVRKKPAHAHGHKECGMSPVQAMPPQFMPGFGAVMPNPSMGMPGGYATGYMPVQQPVQAMPQTMQITAPVMETPAAQPAAPLVQAPSKEEAVEGNKVESPLVGTFYAASAPDAEPFVKKGDTVKKGQTLGIIEAMKLMNNIECEFDGVVADILVNNGDMVEYGQPLFIIK